MTDERKCLQQKVLHEQGVKAFIHSLVESQPYMPRFREIKLPEPESNRSRKNTEKLSRTSSKTGQRMTRLKSMAGKSKK